jgi:AmiR/NasT family two-component response regulator
MTRASPPPAKLPRAASEPGADAGLSALLITDTAGLDARDDQALAADCEAAVIHVLGATSCDKLVRDTVRLAPAVLICRDATRHPSFFDQCELLARVAPTPVVAFTGDADPDRIAQAVKAGVHVYVVNGYARARLRALTQLARQRCAHELQARGQLDDLTHRYEERKLVDRAKGILMQARSLSEEDAFRVLRSTSMHTNQRIGRVAGHVIEAARSAEAVNLAGRLRMLSQRLIKQRVLGLGSADPTRSQRLAAESAAQVDASIATLSRTVSRSAFGGLLDAVAATWQALRAALPAARLPEDLAAADALAERLLDESARLTDALESEGLVTRLRVVNVSGRQRMLAQRVAKTSLLGALGPGAHGAGANTARHAAQHAAQQQAIAEFEAGLAYLHGLPLGGRETRAMLLEAGVAWQGLLAARSQADTPAGQAALDDASEVLLAMFDKLTAGYQQSMNVLMG